MLAYVFVDLFIVTTGFFCFQNRKQSSKKFNRYLFFYLLLVATVLFTFSAFRGNMTADYDNYVDLFYRYDGFSFNQILSRGWFQYPEEGYVLFQYFIRHSFKDSIYLFIFTSLIIVVINLREIGKHREILCILPLLLFVDIGEYYNSFNLIRQVLAASIIVLGSRHLYEKHFFKFLLFVVLATLFHKTSIVMAPFYFLLNIKFSKKSMIFYLVVAISCFLFLDKIIAIIQKYYWSWYTNDGYGMDGYSIKNVIVPCFIGLVPMLYFFINSKKISNKESVWANASCLYFTFSLLGMKVFMVSRLMVFFSLYSILGFSLVISKIKDKSLRTAAYISIIFIVILYGYISKDGTSYNPYFFI